LVNRIANLLVGRFGLVPGNRVLLRAANNPMLVAVILP
jgi:Acyl-coenzyme A synthetases/AMP-(fatty) acid ligases